MFSEAAERERNNEAFAIVTIIGTHGRVPRKEGRMVVFPDGRAEGTVGGGVIESEAKAAALEAIKAGKGRRLVRSQGFGEVEMYIDVPVKDRKVIIVGSGHTGKAVGGTMKSLGWNVRLLERDASVEEVKAEGVNRNTAIVIAGAAGSHLLQPLLETEAFYLGLLAAKGVKVPSDRRVHSPIGLDIGAETPEEIALAAASEILAAFNHRSARPCRDWNSDLVVVRGAGDLATGVIVRLHKAGYKVIALDIEKPTVIRRTVSLAEAAYEGSYEVEGVTGVFLKTWDDALKVLSEGKVPVIADPGMNIPGHIKPVCIVDAIIAKRNMGTKKGMAPLVIALGPGFEAGVDADVVIETKRGHRLGTIITEGTAVPNTGIPGIIAGYGKERVIHSPASGEFRGVRAIGDIVKKGETVAYVGDTPVPASLDGKLRGLLHDGLIVPAGFKIADIDPRGEEAEHLTISDKARAIAGGVLEALDGFLRKN